MKIFRNLKRIISQFFETEYWYRFRKIPYSYFDDFGEDCTNKYIWKKYKARDILTSTWDGEGDMLNMMLLKIEHQFYNLKHYGSQADFYFDSHTIIEHGSKEDKLWAFNKIIEENKFENVKPEDRACNLHFFMGKENESKIYFYIKDKKYLVLEYNKDAIGDDKYFWYIEEKDKKEIQHIPNHNDFKDWEIIDGVIYHEYSVNITVKEYKNLSDELKQFARGNRRTLTELLHLRHMIKRLINLSDTDDKYMNMWQYEKDEEEKERLLKESFKAYYEDRKRLYHEIAEFMAEKGNGWWD